jgi:hypothetical protein
MTIIGNIMEVAKWLKEIAIQLQIANRMKNSSDYEKYRSDAEHEVYQKVD